jgi:hypothetical protein
MYYSQSTGGFYTTEIHGNSIPSDVTEITEAYWQELLEGQSAGKAIKPDANGYPVLQDPPPTPILKPVPISERLAALGIPLADLKAALEAL